MNALNIMWLLNEIDRNTEVAIETVSTRLGDSIKITTNTFEFYTTKTGACVLEYENKDKSIEYDVECFVKVKEWVKSYYKENW